MALLANHGIWRENTKRYAIVGSKTYFGLATLTCALFWPVRGSFPMLKSGEIFSGRFVVG